MIPVVSRGVIILIIGAMTFLSTMHSPQVENKEIVIDNRDSFTVNGEWVHMYDNELFQELRREIINQITSKEYKGEKLKEIKGYLEERYCFDEKKFDEFEFDVRYRSDGTGWFDIDFRDNWSDDFTEGLIEKEINDYPKDFLEKLMKYKD